MKTHTNRPFTFQILALSAWLLADNGFAADLQNDIDEP